MGRRLTLILVTALIAGLAIPAYAEVQNIKVSGDITARFVERGQMDFRTGGATDGVGDPETAGNRYDDVISAFLSTVRLRVDADLTENVSAVVRLINERVWSSDLHEANDSTATAGNAGFAQDALVEVDLAYMTLKEFLYEPLTLVIGRQPIRYGTGFIVGDPDTNQFSEYNHYTAGGTQVDTIVPEDLSSLKAFDAVRAILNYDPMIIDLLYAKINEGVVLGSASTPEHDDVDLLGVNVAYDWGGDKNLASETYVFIKEVSSDGGTGGVTNTVLSNTDDNDRVVTVGTRAHLEPIERLYLAGEVAWQFGKKYVSAIQMRDREAFAYQVLAQYALDMKYSPVLTTSFTHYSGDKDPGTLDGKQVYTAWDPMFEDQSGGKLYNALFPATNCNVVAIEGQITPLEDVKLSIAYAALWLDEAFGIQGTGAQTTWAANDYATYNVNVGKKALGQEVDVVLTYDYTEDVQFGLNAGIFMPGDVFATVQDPSTSYARRENAYQVIGSVKVDF